MKGETKQAADPARPKASDDVDGWLFRAITVHGKRRALKLETVFWAAIDRLAALQKKTAPEVLAHAFDEQGAGSNATSAVRQYVLRHFMEIDRSTQSSMSIEAVANLLNACPSPAFALSGDRRLRLTNAAFLRFVRLSFPGEHPESARNSLRLQIDMPMEELFAAFDDNEGKPVSVGFALGMNERRLRGRISAVPAPCRDEPVILGYIVT